MTSAPKNGATIGDLTLHRSRGVIRGAQAAAVLNGLVTNDILQLAPGAGCYAFALTAKGRMLADVRVFRRADDCLVDLPAKAADGWWAMIRKFVNPRLAAYESLTTSTASLSVHGPDAARLLERATGADPSGLGVYGHLGTDGEVFIARTAEALADNFLVIGQPLSVAALSSRLLELGATPASASDLDVARIEAGRPAWGIDMDEQTLPQEALVDELHAVSYDKGCYTGQETLARVHYRGHVNRRLVGVRALDGRELLTGESLHNEGGAAQGDVRSVAQSPRFGAIGIAMIRREVPEGSTLSRAGDASPNVQVCALPFA